MAVLVQAAFQRRNQRIDAGVGLLTVEDEKIETLVRDGRKKAGPITKNLGLMAFATQQRLEHFSLAAV